MKKVKLRHYKLRDRAILFFAFGLGSGCLRPAPGTWGSALGIILAYFLLPYPSIYLWVTVVLNLVGIWLCQKATDILKVDDYGGIVIDEIAAIFIVLISVPPTFLNLLLAFLLFRIFDILKPWPIRLIDSKLKGGLGIMLDDTIAAVMAWIVLFILMKLY